MLVLYEGMSNRPQEPGGRTLIQERGKHVKESQTNSALITQGISCSEEMLC